MYRSDTFQMDDDAERDASLVLGQPYVERSAIFALYVEAQFHLVGRVFLALVELTSRLFDKLHLHLFDFDTRNDGQGDCRARLDL